MVPAMLFTKVASTLAVSTDWALLGLPLAAVLQVLLRMRMSQPDFNPSRGTQSPAFPFPGSLTFLTTSSAIPLEAETCICRMLPAAKLKGLFAHTQIFAGWLLSSLAVKLVEGGYPEDRKIFGWHPNNPSPSAAAIAGATAAATGVPAAAPALLPRQSAPPKGEQPHAASPKCRSYGTYSVRDTSPTVTRLVSAVSSLQFRTLFFHTGKTFPKKT